MRRFISLLFLTLFCLSATSFPQTDNGCKLKFTGKARKLVKMRSPNRNYSKFRNGDAISVHEFLTELCPDASTKVPDPVPATTVMIVERQTITIRAFVLAMKRDPDNDLHIQIGDKATPYNQAQIVVEIPPTNAYCDARTKMMDLFRADGGTGLTKGYVFDDPPEVEFTGYRS